MVWEESVPLQFTYSISWRNIYPHTMIIWEREVFQLSPLLNLRDIHQSWPFTTVICGSRFSSSSQVLCCHKTFSRLEERHASQVVWWEDISDSCCQCSWSCPFIFFLPGSTASANQPSINLRIRPSLTYFMPHFWRHGRDHQFPSLSQPGLWVSSFGPPSSSTSLPSLVTPTEDDSSSTLPSSSSSGLLSTSVSWIWSHGKLTDHSNRFHSSLSELPLLIWKTWHTDHLTKLETFIGAGKFHSMLFFFLLSFAGAPSRTKRESVASPPMTKNAKFTLSSQSMVSCHRDLSWLPPHSLPSF